MTDENQNLQARNMAKTVIMITGAMLALLATLCFTMTETIAEELNMDVQTVKIIGGALIFVGLTDILVGKFILGKKDVK